MSLIKLKLAYSAIMDAQLSQLLKEHAAYLLAEECGKIKCLLNGHTMPPRYDVVSAFVK